MTMHQSQCGNMAHWVFFLLTVWKNPCFEYVHPYFHLSLLYLGRALAGWFVLIEEGLPYVPWLHPASNATFQLQLLVCIRVPV